MLMQANISTDTHVYFAAKEVLDENFRELLACIDSGAVVDQIWCRANSDVDLVCLKWVAG